MEYVVNDVSLQSEEDVKNIIVTPFLKSLGFDESELEYEKSFEIQIGRNKHKVTCKDQIDTRYPRLDILVKRDGNNLFVVEVKNDKTAITKKEIEQATSYARLVQPVAPFTIITNGKEFCLYNSLDQKKIKNDDFEIKDEYSIALPEDCIQKALQHFIGYSQDNFQIFFSNQLEHNMETLKGSKEQLYKKYIPELHVQREELHKKLIEYEGSDKKVFAILGDSGSGKTCSMCHQAQKFVNNGIPTFFYEPFDLKETILETITEDINIEFSQQADEVQLIKQLSSMFSNQVIFIFIDAIDEWHVANGSQLINHFVKIISSQPNIRIVVSCKNNTWGRYIANNGNPTRINENIFSCSGSAGYYIPPLTDSEFSKSLEKYRLFYKYNGSIDRGLLNECKRSLFLLKIIFTVAKNHTSFTTFSINIYKEYLNFLLQLDTTLESDFVYEILRNAAELSFENDTLAVSLKVLKNRLNLRISEPLPDYLFNYNVLVKFEKNYQTYVKFYFDKLRDYLIAFHVQKWNENDKQFFEKDFKSITIGGVKEQAISFFLPYADVKLKDSLIGAIYSNAEKYLKFYNNVIDKDFPLLKKQFSPFTNDRIGFISLIDISKAHLIMYGFRQIEINDDQHIQFVPFLGLPDNVDKLYDYGARRIHTTSSSNHFQDINIEKEVIKNEILNQLDDIISSGQLIESQNINLLIEKALAINYKALDFSASQKDIKDFCTSILTYSRTLKEIGELLKYKRGLNYYRSELVEQRVLEGKFKRVVSGSRVHTSTPFTPEDNLIIEEKARKASIDDKIVFPRSGFREFEEMNDSFQSINDNLKSHSIKTINKSLCLDFDKVETPDYLVKLYEQFLSEYKSIVETNFPTLKQYFNLYSMMPLNLYIITETHSNSGVWLKLFYESNKSLTGNKVHYIDQSAKNITWYGCTLTIDSKSIVCRASASFSLQLITHARDNYLGFGVPNQFAVLRNLVYETVKNELAEVKKHLLELYEVEN